MLPPPRRGKRGGAGCGPPQPRRASTQAAASKSASSRNRGPISWMPSGSPCCPAPAGKVTHGVHARVQIALNRASPVEVEAHGRLADSTRRQQHVEFAENVVEAGAKCLGRFDCRDVIRQRHFSAGGQQAVAQARAQSVAVLLVFVGVVARRLERENPVLVVEKVGRDRGGVGDGGTGCGQPRRGALKQGLGVGARVLPGGRAAKADAGRARCPVDRAAGLHLQRRAHQRHVVEAAADDAKRVEVVALHLDADAAELAEGGFVADNPAKRRRADRRAAGLCAEPDRHLEIGDRRGRSARRAARRVRRVQRVHGLARVTVGEFGRHCLAEDHAARGPGQRDAGGVGKGPMAAIDRRAVLGRHVVGVDHVLDPDRDTLQHAGPPGMVGGAGLGQCQLGVEPHPGLDRGARRGALKAIVHQGFGRQAPGFEAGRRVARGQPFGAAHGISPCASRRSTHRPTSSSRASSWRWPTS